VENAVTVWEQEIARRFVGRRMPDQSVGTQVEIEQVEASIVDEVVRRLRPQVSSVRRMLRAPRLTTDPKAANLVRQGIQAAAYNNWDGAEALFHEALQEAPTECFIEGNLAVAYERSGRFLDAVSAYERAYRCQPQDPTYRFYSSDLQTAFAPDLGMEDLPVLVLGVREDGVIYLNVGKGGRHHSGDQFVIYRTGLLRDQKTGSIKALHENEFAIGEIIEMNQGLSLGRLLLFDPDLEVQRGDLVRFIAR
jgi:tetratricopeptide (TPR) repeat protein